MYRLPSKPLASKLMRRFTSFCWSPRFIALLTTLLAARLQAEAQLLSNGSFNSSSSCIATDPDTPFQRGCVPGWSASHGSPQIKGAAPNQYAYFWSYGTAGAGEGIYSALALTPNQRYQVNFWSRNSNAGGPSTTRVNVELASNLIPNTTTTGVGTVPNPASRTLLLQQTLTTTWAPYTLQFAAPNWASTQLWFYAPSTTSASQQYDVNVDSIRVTSCLTGDLFYQNIPALGELARTQGKIFAGTAVTTSRPQGPVVVQSYQTTSFRALKEIALLDGFSVNRGEFEALSISCGQYSSKEGLAARNASTGPANPTATPQDNETTNVPLSPCQCLGVAATARGIAVPYPEPAASVPPMNQRTAGSEGDTLVVSAELQLSPNPTAGQLTFRPTAKAAKMAGTFTIYAKDGQPVKVLNCADVPWKEDAFVLDVSFLANGLYHYRYVSGPYTDSGHFMMQK